MGVCGTETEGVNWKHSRMGAVDCAACGGHDVVFVLCVWSGRVCGQYRAGEQYHVFDHAAHHVLHLPVDVHSQDGRSEPENEGADRDHVSVLGVQCRHVLLRPHHGDDVTRLTIRDCSYRMTVTGD